MIHTIINNSISHKSIYYCSIVNYQKHLGAEFVIYRMRDQSSDPYSTSFGINKTVKSTYNIDKDYKEVGIVKLILMELSELKNVYNNTGPRKIYFDSQFFKIGDILKGKISYNKTVHYVVASPINTFNDSLYEYSLSPIESHED